MHEPLLPTLPGFYPDPSICRAGEEYFLTTSSFEYFPGLPLFHSRDLRHWRQIGHILDRPSQLPLAQAWISGGIYAPTLRVHGDTFYCITTNASAPRAPEARNFFVKTQDPFAAWSEPIWIEGMAGIDPDLFWDVDGRCFTQWSWKVPGRPAEEICIGQAAIELESGRLLEAPRRLWTGTGGLGPEGPHLYLKNGWYYLSIAEGGTEYGHMQTLARSRSARGPFEPCPHNPVLTHRSRPTSVHAVGHCDIVEAPDGRWIGVGHGIRPQGYHKFHLLGRETFMFPVEWGPDGWPAFGEEGMLPANSLTDTVDTAFEDRFDTPDWPLPWNALRNPDPQAIQREGTGRIVLTGGAPLHSLGKPVTWRGVRQRDHAFRLEAEIQPDYPGESGGGVTVFQNLNHHACLGLRRANDTHEGFTRIRLGEIVIEETFALDDVSSKPSPAPFVLIVEGEPLAYHLAVRQGDTEQRVKSFDARLLSTEFGGRFTGVYLALYAEGPASMACTAFRYRPA